jgi:acyl carrier protein
MSNKLPFTASLDDVFTFLQIGVSLENYFGINITDEEWSEISDIQDIIDLINSKKINI